MKCEECNRGAFLAPDVVFVDEDECTVVYHAECCPRALEEAIGYYIDELDDE